MIIMGKMKKGEWFSPFLFFPQILSFYIFPQQPVFPLMDHEMSRQYTIINKSVTYINKNNHSPPFPFLLLPFPFCLLFSFCFSLPNFRFFPRAPFPPLALVFWQIYTQEWTKSRLQYFHNRHTSISDKRAHIGTLRMLFSKVLSQLEHYFAKLLQNWTGPL